MSEIRNPQLWESGELKIEWVRHHMPLLEGLEKEFKETKPFKGLKVALSVHLEAKTAHLCEVLSEGGAEMYVTGSNPLSTQDDVAAALAHEGLNVFAVHGATPEEYEHGIRRVLECGPNIIIDDGGDLVTMIHEDYPHLIPNIIGGCEETTTGILRLETMNREKRLRFPMMLVNNAACKHFFDNRYGTGQSVWDGINRTTNLIVAGKYVVVAGYGWCGKGVAMRAKGLGAKVIVTEVDPIKAMEAVMDGFQVMGMAQAAAEGLRQRKETVMTVKILVLILRFFLFHKLIVTAHGHASVHGFKPAFFRRDAVRGAADGNSDRLFPLRCRLSSYPALPDNNNPLNRIPVDCL